MTCDCPTCQCDHAGTFPEFSVLYADGTIVDGGGPDDVEQTVFSWPTSWINMPPFGVTLAASFDRVCGRRWHRGMERIYATPFQARGGADITATGIETGIMPLVSGHLGIVKSGEHARTERYHEAMRRLSQHTHVPTQSTESPFDLERGAE